MKSYELYVKSFDETELFLQFWKPKAHPQGQIFITHGISEHSDNYVELANALSQEFSWSVFAWDLRGHGRSSGKRGYVSNFTNYTKDWFKVYQYLKAHYWDPAIPLALFGHSMGGLITTLSYQEYSLNANGLCLSSPAFGLAFEPPRLKELLAQLAGRFYPKLTLWNEVQYKSLTHEEAKIKEYSSDPLRHDKISPMVYLGLLEGFQKSFQNVNLLNRPVLMQLAGKDKIVSTSASIELFEKIPHEKKQLHVYSDSFHEVFNDIEKTQAVSDLKGFLNQLGTKVNT